MFHYMDAKIRRSGYLMSHDGHFVDLRHPDKIRQDKIAEIEAVKTARQYYVQALEGLYNITYQKGATGDPVRTFSKVQYFIGKDDDRLSTGRIPSDNMLGYSFGFTTTLVPAQVRNYNGHYPTVRPYEKAVHKEVQNKDIKTYTHFTFPDGPYGFIPEGENKYAVSEQWLSSDGYNSGRIQGGGGVFIGGIRYDLTGAFPANGTTYTVECARTVQRQRYLIATGATQDDITFPWVVPIYDEWSVKDMLDVVTLLLTARAQPDPHPETDYTRGYNGIDEYLLRYRRSRRTDWRVLVSGISFGQDIVAFGEQFCDGNAIYYYSELGIGLALYQSGVIWPSGVTADSVGTAPCGPVSLIQSDAHFHKSYIRGVDGRKLSGDFLLTGTSWGLQHRLAEMVNCRKGVFVSSGNSYEAGARHQCLLNTDPAANHIFRQTSASVLEAQIPYSVAFSHTADTHGINIAERCLRIHWSGYPSLTTGQDQYIPFVTMVVNDTLVPVVGPTRAVIVPTGTEATFIPGGEDFTSCTSQQYQSAVSINAHGAALYTRTDGEYKIDVLTFHDEIGSVSFPTYRSPEKLLNPNSGTLHYIDYAIVASVYHWPFSTTSSNSSARYVVNKLPADSPTGGGEYVTVTWTLGGQSPNPTLVTPTVTGRTITCDLPQGWIAYLSRRYRSGPSANVDNHIGEGPSGNSRFAPMVDDPSAATRFGYSHTFWYDKYDDAGFPGNEAKVMASRPDTAGSTPSGRLPSPGAFELPRPVNSQVNIPAAFTGDWYLQIVDTYYCIMLEFHVSL